MPISSHLVFKDPMITTNLFANEICQNRYLSMSGDQKKIPQQYQQTDQDGPSTIPMALSFYVCLFSFYINSLVFGPLAPQAGSSVFL